MGRTLTVGQIATQVRLRGEWRSTYITDTELYGYIGDSIAALKDLVTAQHPLHSSLLKRADITVVSGTSRYALPADEHLLFGVAVRDTSQPDGYVVLEQYAFEERYADSYADQSAANTRWRKWDGYLQLQPTPNWSGKLRLEYAATIAITGSSSQSFDFDNSWHEWVVLDVCEKCCAKEETDPSVYMAQKKATFERITVTQNIEDRVADIRRTTSTSSTLAAIRRAIRGRGPWPIEEITDSQLTEMVNSSMCGLEDVVLSTNPMHSDMLRMSDIIVVSGTGMYTLPSDTHTLYGVSVADATKPDGYCVLERFSWDERYADDYNNTPKTACRWDRWGNQLRLQPVPNWSGKVRLEYAKSFTKVYNPTDDLAFESSWHEWIILDCCVKCAAKIKFDPAVYLAQQKAVVERIQGTIRAEEMIAQEPKTTSGSTTLADLRRSVRARGMWLRSDHADSQLTEWINASIVALVDMMVVRDPSFFVARKDISIVSGTRAYALPTNLYRLIGMAVKDPQVIDGYTVLERYNWEERYDASWSSQKLDTRYLIVGNNVEFHPVPSWTDTVRVEYVPYPTALAVPSDTFDFRNGWQEWVILDCSAKAAMAKGGDPRMYMGQRDEVVKRLLTAMPRDIGKPKTVADAHRIARRDWRLWPRR
jgi:hypothetical protein